MDINLIRYTSLVTHEYIQDFLSNGGSHVINTPNDGAGELGVDDDFNTYHGDQRSNGVYGSGATNVDRIESVHTFSRPMTINQIKFRLYARGYNNGNYYQNHSYNMHVDYSTDGVNWIQFTDAYYSGGGGGNSDTNVDTGTVTKDQVVEGVVKIRAYVTCTAGCAEGSWGTFVRIYELQAFGQPFIDVGLRAYINGAVKKIGVEAVTTSHKLRIVKGGVTYGISLVATDDTLALPIRIYDGSVVKSLAEVT